MQKKMQWLYGVHAVKAALENPKREILKLFVINDRLQQDFSQHGATVVPKSTFDNLFPPQTVHQGIAAQVSCLKNITLEDLLKNKKHDDLMIMLDQVTDPHNVGAILRSAAAFGAKAVIIQERNSPAPENAILAKTASGALEQVPLVMAKNLARALTSLKKAGYWILGLDEQGVPLSKTSLPRPLVLVLGAEGKGVRRLIQKESDLLVCLPTSSTYTTLNVSNAAAVALYAAQVAIIGESQ